MCSRAAPAIAATSSASVSHQASAAAATLSAPTLVVSPLPADSCALLALLRVDSALDTFAPAVGRSGVVAAARLLSTSAPPAEAPSLPLAEVSDETAAHSAVPPSSAPDASSAASAYNGACFAAAACSDGRSAAAASCAARSITVPNPSPWKSAVTSSPAPETATLAPLDAARPASSRGPAPSITLRAVEGGWLRPDALLVTPPSPGAAPEAPPRAPDARRPPPLSPALPSPAPPPSP